MIEEKWIILKNLLEQVGGQEKLYKFPWKKYQPNEVFDQAYSLCEEIYNLLNGKVFKLSNDNFLVPIPDRHKVNHVRELEEYKGEKSSDIKQIWNALKNHTEDTKKQNKKFYNLYSSEYTKEKKRNLELYSVEVQ